MLVAALLVAANAGEGAAVVGRDHITCSVQSSDVVVPPGGEASIIITVAYNVTRVQTIYASMEPVSGYAFTSGRFLAWPAGARTSTGNLTVTNTDPDISFGRTAVLVDGSACAAVTVQTGAPTLIASATATTTVTGTSTSTTTITTASTYVSVVVSTSTATTTATITMTTATNSGTPAITAGATTSSSSSAGASLMAKALVSQEAQQLRSSLSAFSNLVFLLQMVAGASLAATVGLAARHYVKKRSSKRGGEPPPPQTVTLS